MTASPVERGGFLPVDKPEGPTSHDVVARARRALGIRKVGHTGTLDPFASGLLLLCVGPATRLAEFVSALDKEYVAEAVLGVETDTLDREGRILRGPERLDHVDPERIESALAGLRGERLQRPPSFSAKKVGGEAAHRRARRGESVELVPVPVVVHRIELIDLELPLVRFRVRCSAGTYVRALARDLGEALQVGAHLRALRRTRIGPFRVEDALGTEELGEADRVEAAWIPSLAAVGHLPRVDVTAEEAGRLAQGQEIPLRPNLPETPEGRPVAVALGEELLAVGERRGPSLRPRKVLVHG